MRFFAAVGAPKKSGVARFFPILATAVLANFQAHLVPITSHFNNKNICKLKDAEKINTSIIP